MNAHRIKTAQHCAKTEFARMQRTFRHHSLGNDAVMENWTVIKYSTNRCGLGADRGSCPLCLSRYNQML